MELEYVKSLFIVAKIPATNFHELKNQYWPEVYPEAKEPWWLVITPYGPIKIGKRKRVTEIDWLDTKLRKIITSDDVTKTDTYVHAWSPLKLVEYMIALSYELKTLEAISKSADQAA